MIQTLERIVSELIVMAVIVFLLFVVKVDGSPGAQLVLYKILLFSASQVHAMILRKVMFPYIDFSAAKIGVTSASKWMVIALHVSAALVYGMGG